MSLAKVSTLSSAAPTLTRSISICISSSTRRRWTARKNSETSFSSFAVRRISDRLQGLIDAFLSACKDFDGFLSAMKTTGTEVKAGKHLAFKIPGSEKFIRCKSLGDDYTEDAIRERLSGKRVVTPKQKAAAPVAASTKPNLLIDVQVKTQQGHALRFEHYAKLHNLKEMEKTLIFLQERNLTEYNVLSDKTAALLTINVSAHVNGLRYSSPLCRYRTFYDVYERKISSQKYR